MGKNEPGGMVPPAPPTVPLQELIGPRFRRPAVPYRGERTITYIDGDRSIPRRKQRASRGLSLYRGPHTVPVYKDLATA